MTTKVFLRGTVSMVIFLLLGTLLVAIVAQKDDLVSDSNVGTSHSIHNRTKRENDLMLRLHRGRGIYSGHTYPASWACTYEPSLHLINPMFICDGVAQCWDGSEEQDCNEEYAPWVHYPELRFTCNNGRYMSIRKRCNGWNDCRDIAGGSDEADCDQIRPEQCNPADKFRCRTDGACLSISVRCDDNIDCIDASDEAYCTPPAGTNLILEMATGVV